MKKWRKKPLETTILTSGGDALNPPNGWAVVEGRLMREFSFTDFAEAKAFIDGVSEVCETLNHHAELHFGWGYAVVETYSHDAESITERDLELAEAINQMRANDDE
jgi:4a-hydroxytetrahydrobiopterin dehydratase